MNNYIITASNILSIIIIILIILMIVYKLRLLFYVYGNKKEDRYIALLKKYDNEVDKNKKIKALKIISIIALIFITFLTALGIYEMGILALGILFLPFFIAGTEISHNTFLTKIFNKMLDKGISPFTPIGRLSIVLYIFILVLILSILSIKKSITIYNEMKK